MDIVWFKLVGTSEVPWTDIKL